MEPGNLGDFKFKPIKDGSWSKWSLALATLAVVFLGGLLSLFSIFSGSNGGGVILEFSKPDQIFVGQPFVVGVSFSNPSDNSLEEAKLSMSLPEGVSFVGQSQDQRVMEILVGDVGPGSLNNQKTFTLIALSGNQTLKRLSAKMIYKTSGSSAQFEENSDSDLVLGQPAVNLNISVPTQVFNGENFEIKVDYRNNSSQDIKDLRLKIDYPPVFRFAKSSEVPSVSNNLWEIGDFGKGASSSITIEGNVVGPERSFFGFNVTLTANFSGQTYTINNQAASLSVAGSPLSLQVALNNTTDYVAHVGDDLIYTLHYRNNSEIAFENASIKATLTGELFNFATITGKGFFNSLTNTYTWTVASLPELAVLQPNQEGFVELTVKLKDSFPVRRLGDKNFTLKIQSQIESPTVPVGTAAGKTLSIANLENKVSGQFNVDASAFFRDAGSGIVNSGPYPPRVNQPTQYTIHWRISNYAVDLNNVQLVAFLQSGARFTGQVKSNVDSQPVYDAASGRVSWQISKLGANRGVSGIADPAEAIFQIELTPAVNQIGSHITFLGQTSAQAQDIGFTGLTMTNSDLALTTALPDDPTVMQGGAAVQP